MQQQNATNRQLGIAEQGQVTDRYNAATTNLGSSSVDVRLGGIYALHRIMQDSPRDQPTVVAVLCAFVRDHAHGATASSHTLPILSRPPTDIQAALTVVSTRGTAHDGSTTVVDYTGVDFSGVYWAMENFSGAELFGADLSGANLTRTDFTGAYLAGADLTGAILTGTKGLPPGIRRSPAGSTPASTKNLRRWATG